MEDGGCGTEIASWAQVERLRAVVREARDGREDGEDALVLGMLRVVLRGEIDSIPPEHMERASGEIDADMLDCLRRVLTEDMLDGEEDVQTVLEKRACLDAIGMRWLALLDVCENGLDEEDTSGLTPELAREELVMLSRIVLWTCPQTATLPAPSTQLSA